MADTSIEVLVERIDGLRDLITEKFKTNEVGHTAILLQTTKTNGRVSALESWKNKVTGGLVITNLIILPILFWLLWNHMSA